MARARTRSVKKIVLTLLAILVVAFLGLFAYVRIFLAPKVYDVVSIKTVSSYQDEALIERAWSLPVASTYGPDALQFQPKASSCWCRRSPTKTWRA